MEREEQKQDCWYKEVCSLESCINCERYKQMRFLIDNSEIPESRQTPAKLYPKEEDKQVFIRLREIKENIKKFTEEGRNLYICGEYSTSGKTAWALKILLKYFDEIWNGNAYRVRGVFVSTQDFLMKLKNFNDETIEEYKNKILSADLVVFDDITVQNVSNFDYTNLFYVIDNRILNKKSNI